MEPVAGGGGGNYCTVVLLGNEITGKKLSGQLLYMVCGFMNNYKFVYIYYLLINISILKQNTGVTL